MGKRAAVKDALGTEVKQVESHKTDENGLSGEALIITGHNGRVIEVFLADRNKITNEQAVKIVRSYLWRLESRGKDD